MKKVNALQENIHLEEEKLSKKIEQMKAEMHDYEDLEVVQEKADDTKDYLLQMKERYETRIAHMKKEVKQVSSQYEVYTEKLKRSDTWVSLLDLEEKLRRQGQTVFLLSDTVRAEGRETDFQSVKYKCICAVTGLNDAITNTS